MNCDEIKKKLTDYPDSIIDPNERESIEEHLALCPNCGEEQEALAKAHAEICRVMETTAAKASLSPNMWTSIKGEWAQKRRRWIPSFGGIKAKVAGWARRFWARPVWQRAVSVAAVAAITATLLVTQLTVGLSPAGVIARAQGAAAEVDSYHVSQIYTDSRNSDIRRVETDFVAPDRRNSVAYDNDIKTSETRSIGDHHYRRQTETGEWTVSVNEWTPQPLAQMSELLATLADLSDIEVEVFDDEVVGGILSIHHKASFYDRELLLCVTNRILESETDPDEIERLEQDLEWIQRDIAEGYKGERWTFEYWIGKSDYLLRQLNQLHERELEGESFISTSESTYSQFNEPIQIEAPPM